MVRFILCVRLLTQLKLEGKSERIRIAKNITVAVGIYFAFFPCLPSCAVCTSQHLHYVQIDSSTNITECAWIRSGSVTLSSVQVSLLTLYLKG